MPTMTELRIKDWRFLVDLDATMIHNTAITQDHCTCGYCQNYYGALDQAYPELRSFLAQFGIDPEGPQELMPFEPTLYLAAFQVFGRVLEWGREALLSCTDVVIQETEQGFLLLVGELSLPWVLEEDMDQVISPANTPEYLERMLRFRLERESFSGIYS